MSRWYDPEWQRARRRSALEHEASRILARDRARRLQEENRNSAGSSGGTGADAGDTIEVATPEGFAHALRLKNGDAR